MRPRVPVGWLCVVSGGGKAGMSRWMVRLVV